MSEEKISRGQLLAYLDGEADPQTAALIQQSPTYRRQAEELAQYRQFLSETLRLTTPPDPLLLAEYDLDLLSPEQAAAVHLYLEHHPHAAAQLEALRAIWRQYAPTRAVRSTPASAESKPLQALKLWLAEKLSPPLPGSLPALAGVRGQTELVYQAGPVQLVIEVDDALGQLARKNLTGLLLGLPDGMWRVRCWSVADSEQEWETAVDLDHTFLLDNLPTGQYALLVYNQEDTDPIEIYVESLTV